MNQRIELCMNCNNKLFTFFILILLDLVLFLPFLPLQVEAMPLCNCNEHSDCPSGYFCVYPMSAGAILYNPCDRTSGYDGHCKPCKNEGEVAYWECQCGENKCTYGHCSNRHCCADGGTWNPDTSKCVYPPTCTCLLYTSPSPRDKRQSRMPSSA